MKLCKKFFILIVIKLNRKFSGQKVYKKIGGNCEGIAPKETLLQTLIQRHTNTHTHTHTYTLSTKTLSKTISIL